MSSLTRAALYSLLPDGSLWHPAPNEDLDNLLDGVADNWEDTRGKLAPLADLRSPWRTPYLSDLELDYGITPNPSLSDFQRRTNLAARKSKTPPPTAAGLQGLLDLLGFGDGGYGLKVFDNTGLANPQPFAQTVAAMCAGQNWAIAGNAQAYAGMIGGGGTLIVNGQISLVSPDYWGAGMTSMVAGNVKAMAGYYETQTIASVTYPIPADPNYWGCFFFLATAVTKVGSTIVTLTPANIPQLKQAELVDTICRVKPMWTWAIAAVNWV